MCQPLGNYDMSFALLSTLKSIAGLFVLLASKPKVMDGLGRSRCQEAPGARPLSFANDAVSIAIAGAGNLPRRETPAQSRGALHTGFACRLSLVTR